MYYMNRNVHKRYSPRDLVPGAKSIISLAVSYAPARTEQQLKRFVSAYACGRDYHEVLKNRCRRLMRAISELSPEFSGRAFVDTAPLAERSVAATAGVGWIGRNGCLIVPNVGSYVFLCEIVSNLPLRPDSPMESECRDCGRCMQVCPTGAFVSPGLIDANKCFSYLTVEHRGKINHRYWPLMGCRVFGCDTCQLVCPFNQDIPPGDEELVSSGQASALCESSLAEILRFEPDEYAAAVRGTAVHRANYQMFMRNAVIAAGNSQDASLIPALKKLDLCLHNHDEVIRWAMERLNEQQTTT